MTSVLLVFHFWKTVLIIKPVAILGHTVDNFRDFMEIQNRSHYSCSSQCSRLIALKTLLF